MRLSAAGRTPSIDGDPPEPLGSPSSCTGTLIGPRQVLTAAHCVDDLRSGWFELGDGSGRQVPIYGPQIPPSYGAFDKLSGDIAVVFLAESVDDIAPATLLPGAVAPDEQITLVGYGITGEDKQDGGIKRSANNEIDELAVGYFVFSGLRWGDGMICSGDSGGPSFVTRGSQRLLAGVHSRSTCEETSWLIFDDSGSLNTRVDVHANWIRTVAAMPPPVPTPSLTVQPLGSPTPGAFQLRVSAFGRQRVERIQLYINAALYEVQEAPSATFLIAGLPPGTHQLELVAIDEFGFRGVDRRSFSMSASPNTAPPALVAAGEVPSAASPSAWPTASGNAGGQAGGCALGADGSAPSVSWLLLIAWALLRRRRDHEPHRSPASITPVKRCHALRRLLTAR